MAREAITSDMGWRGDWTAIRSGAPEPGLSRLTRDFEQDKSDASTALDLVAAHMWLGQYEKAERVCIESEAARPPSRSFSEYAVQRGAALWCMGRFEDARLAWWQAAKANYGDAAGANVHYLLLLLADITLTGGDPSRVREELEKKRTDSRVHSNWPGPIAMFQLGIYAASYVTNNAVDHVDRWQLEFYRIVKTFGLRRQREAMLTEFDVLLAKVDRDENLDAFIRYVRLPELYLAREMRRVLPEG